MDIERKLYKVICIGNLAEEPSLIKAIQRGLGEPTGAPNIAAPLEAE